jgi:hypothetical protein
MLLKNKEKDSVITVPCASKFDKYDVGINNINFHSVSFDQVKELKGKQNENNKRQKT